MKKLVIITTIIILIIILIFLFLNGVNLFGLKIGGFDEIKNANDSLNSKLTEVSKLTSVTYNEKISSLNSAYKTLETTKKDVQDKLTYRTEQEEGKEVEAINKIKEYEIEFLWSKLGSYAKKEKISLKFDVSQSSSGTKGKKDLKFTINGSYLAITDFIYDLENDTKLGFKIEKFVMQPSGSDANSLQATFTVKDISINVDDGNETSNNQPIQNNPGNENNSTSSNTVNTTNNTSSNETSNTSNTANTVNTTINNVSSNQTQ